MSANFPTGDNTATRNRHDSMTKANTNTNSKNEPQEKHRLGTASKKITVELKHMFDGTNLTLITDVYQDT